MEFVVEKNERLDKFLAEHHKKFSRTQWQRFIKDGAIKVNDHLAVKPGTALKKGDRITIIEEKLSAGEKEFKIEPEPDTPLKIAYEDKDIAVIDKPAGLLTHPTLSQRRHTLVNALVHRYPNIVGVGENPLRPGIVHRLDKDTSGLLVVAKNQNAFMFLKEQFMKRGVIKKYLALVEGIPKEKGGIIKYQIRPSKKNRLRKVAVLKEDISGKKSVRAAETSYKVIKQVGETFSLVEAMPKTGRTHQIRVHLAAIGHPVVGDKLYGAKSGLAKRQLLHAAYLSFTAPSGKKIALESDLPNDFQAAINYLKTD